MANKTFQNVKINVAFTPATTHDENVATGDNLAVALGKIAKWYEDFDSVVWDGNATTVNNLTVETAVPANAKFTDTTYTAGDGVTLTGTKFTNSGVRAVTKKADSNGVISVNTNGTSADVTVYTHPTSGVTAGTYKSVTVDKNGHVTAGTNPTTLAGYGITDAFTETEVDNKLALKAPLASPALTGTPTAPTAAAGTNTTQIATTAFVTTAISNGIAASDAMIFKGTLGTGGTVTELPKTYKTGWTYRVITAGTYAGQVCEIGDLIIALTDRTGTGNTNADWTVAQTNIDGAITAADKGLAKTGSTVGHAVSGRAKTADLYNITVDEYGHVSAATAVVKKDITDLGIPAQDTTYTANTGLKIATGNVIQHTNAVTAVTTAGLLKVKYDAQGHITESSAVTKADITGLGIPGADTHHVSNNVVGATTALTDSTTALANGAVYLNSVENNKVTSTHKISGSGLTSVKWDATAKAIVIDSPLPTASTTVKGGIKVDGQLITVASDVIKVRDMVGATADGSGKNGLVPTPTNAAAYLRGDGTWSTDPVVSTDTLTLNCVA